MAKVHFFAELDTLPTYDTITNTTTGQRPVDMYGPVSPTLQTKYRTGSKFKLDNVDVMAYAVVNGTAFIQPQWDVSTNAFSTTLVNIVIKPLGSHQINFTSIEYLIYRGIKKSDFFDTNGDFLPENDPGNSGFLKEVWLDWRSALNNNLTGSPISKNRVGIHYDSENDNFLLDNVFLKNKILSVNGNQPVQLASVSEGMSLGHFMAGIEIGFDIILKDKFFNPTLGYVRAADSIITVSTPSGGEFEGNQSIQSMRDREQILNFIDPAVFFMLFIDEGVDYRISTSNIKQTVQGIYPLAASFAAKFQTKNTVYIDLRNEFGNSLNYFKDNQGVSTDGDFGKHFNISINGSGLQNENYYQNYWPIYSLNNITSTALYNTISIGVRKKYNPTPIVYTDFGYHDFEFTNLQIGGERFRDDDGTNNDYTQLFDYYIPNDSLSLAPSWICKINILRSLVDNSTLPITAIKKNHFLDNVFGPILPFPSLSTTKPLTWINTVGKKFINAQSEAGIQFVVEISTLFSNDDVAFIANIVDYRIFGDKTKMNPILEVFNIGNGDSSDNSFNAIKKALSNIVEIRKSEIPTTTSNIIIMPNYFFDYDHSDDFQYVFAIYMTKQEYINKIYPASLNLDSTTHDICINFNTVSVREAISLYGPRDRYYDFLIQVSGLDNSGDYQEIAPLGGNLLGYSTDSTFWGTEAFGLYASFFTETSSDPNAYITVDNFIEYVKKVEAAYPTLDSEVKHTATRIRVHSYGSKSKDNILIGLTFEHSLKGADYLLGERYLQKGIMNLIDGGADARAKLISNADENGFRTNLSPYILVPQPTSPNIIRQSDMGQILYGFESLATPSIQNPQIADGYLGYPINKAYDLTAIIANIATPAANVAYHREMNKSAEPSLYAPPQTPDLDKYYEISAPDADLLGNVDALGVAKAYANLIGNIGLKLSDVLLLYYKGTIRSGLILHNVEQYYTVKKRWLILAIEFGLVVPVGAQYKWLPDITSVSDPDYALWQLNEGNILSRMYNFAEFWFNHFFGINYSATGSRIALDLDTDIVRFTSYTFVNTNIGQITTDIKNSLELKFLPFVKNEILIETPSILI